MLAQCLCLASLLSGEDALRFLTFPTLIFTIAILASCVREAEHGRSIIPDYLLYQPHREGYPIEFVAKGMLENDKDLVSKGVEMQEEFLQYVIEVGYLRPWEEPYFVSYVISVISRTLLSE